MEKSNGMCYYWYLIVKLQTEILLYVRSLRESMYKFLTYAMKNLMKSIFSFDHYNYVRWATVHLFDLITLHKTCPHVYAQFLKKIFLFKYLIENFQIAFHQVHEQNNEKLKGVSGATHLVNRADFSGLE